MTYEIENDEIISIGDHVLFGEDDGADEGIVHAILTDPDTHEDVAVVECLTEDGNLEDRILTVPFDELELA